MSLHVRRSRKSARSADWLLVHRAQFLRKLADEGYTRGTLGAYGAAASLLCKEVSRRGIRQGRLVDQTLVKVRAAIFDGLHPRFTYKRFCLDRFIDHLVEAGVATRPKPPPEGTDATGSPPRGVRGLPSRPARAERGDDLSLLWLPEAVHERSASARSSATSTTSRPTISSLPAQRSGAGRSPSRDKTPPTHLRNLFRFLFWSGKTKRDLANSLPRVAQPRQSHLPRYLKPEEIEQLIDAVRSADRGRPAELCHAAAHGAARPAGARGHRHPARRHRLARRHDPDPGQGQAARPHAAAGRRRQGHRRLHPEWPARVVPCAVRLQQAAVRAVRRRQDPQHGPAEAFERTGLKPPQKYVGSHLLRHSLATDMLRKGASLDEIGDVLRHRSRTSTTIYAKHDIEALRSIARAWPVEGGRA